jgi:hypothetical protein
MSQGANQAIIDAFCLATELSKEGALEDAIGRFERQRKPATTLLMLEVVPTRHLSLSLDCSTTYVRGVNNHTLNTEIEISMGCSHELSGRDLPP